MCSVGMTGFEPAASSSRTTRATGLRYIPNRSCKGNAYFLNLNILLLQKSFQIIFPSQVHHIIVVSQGFIGFYLYYLL